MEMESFWQLVMLACVCLGNIHFPVVAQNDEPSLSKYEWQTQLYENLFKTYHKGVPPTTDGPVTVELSLSLVNFDFVDEPNEIASVHGWLFQTWTDSRLTWNAELYDNTTYMKIDADDVWLPDVEMYNTGTLTENVDADVIVYNTGYVLRVPSVVINFKCKMDLKFFPYDKQACELKFGSWHYSSDVLNLTQTKPVDMFAYNKSNDFKIRRTTWERHAVKYPCCPEKYVDITYTLHLKRISSAYSVKLVLPAVLTGFLILASFLLPPASYEKITLCGLIFVALLLQLIYLHDIVPRSGDTILGEYFAFALFLDFLAIIMAVLSYHVHVRSVPKTHEQSKSIFMSEMEGDDNDLKLQTPPNRKRELLRYMDFVCFVVFGIVFVVGLAIIVGRRE